MTEFELVDTADRIRRFLRESQLAPENAPLTPLTADASDRRYVRVSRNDDESIVLAVHAAPIEFATLPFANVTTLLHRMALPAPRILGHSDRDGILALSDLGDMTLQAHLAANGGADRTALYRNAVELIEQLQRRGGELASDEYVPYRIAFDVDKLTWELNFFVRHFLESYRGATLDDDDRATLADEWRLLAGELAAEPRVLCHRDYHSRNLMVVDGGLYLIDFQDARLGPDTYDLVSLLRDSYVDFEEAEVDDLIAYFLALKQGTAREEFRRRFDVMAVQRNLKALGTFGFQTTTKSNPVYVQYIPRTAAHARRNLKKYKRFERIISVLEPRLDEA
jgi:aminoglycoside/choline kinase family phosphotransferase